MRRLALERSDGRILVTCALADRSHTRLRGLLGRRELRPGEGVVLHPASAVHTAFMRFPIDVVFLDRTLRVLRIERSLRPWRAAARIHTAAVMELAAGECERQGLAVGDRLVARILSDPKPARSRSRAAVAALATVLAAACLLRSGGPAAGLIAAFACAVLVALAYVDAISHRLPNRIVLPAAAVVLAARLSTDPAHWRIWLGASLGAGGAFLVVALVFPAALGMGDAKLSFLLGAALGAGTLPAVLLGTAAAGLVGVLLVGRFGRAALTRPLPLGPFLAAGAIVLLLALPA